MQLGLFDPATPEPADAVKTVASPLCMYQRQPCWRKGRAVYGEPEDHGECINRRIRCLTCGCTGEESASKAVTARKAAAAAHREGRVA